MARRSKKTVSPTARTRTVQIDGKEMTLEFNFLAYITMHNASGIELVKGVDYGSLSAQDMLALLYSGLITHQPDIDFQSLATKLNGADFVDLFKVTIEACTASFPPPEPNEDPTQPIAQS